MRITLDVERFLFFGLFVCFFLLAIPPVSADKAMFGPFVLYEPGQKAILAWDGQNETLILSTDVYASENSWALEVLPLPSMPSVAKGDREAFENANSVILSHVASARNQETQRTFGLCLTALLAGLCATLIAIYRLKVNLGVIFIIWVFAAILVFLYGALWGVGLGPAEAVLFHENIGAHDIMVVRSDNARGLIDWAEDYLENRGIAYELPSAEIEPLLTTYIENEINYFVFDLVYLERERRSVDPIVYKFKSRCLYYPLAITSVVSGTTEITLITLTTGKVEEKQIERAGFHVGSSGGIDWEFDISEDELERFGPEIAEMFDGGARVTGLKYKGSLADLSVDLKAGVTEVYKVPWNFIFWVGIACLWTLIVILTYRILVPKRS